MTRKLKPVVKVSDELKKMLNDAIAIEIAASVQYMWQYIQDGNERSSCCW